MVTHDGFLHNGNRLYYFMVVTLITNEFTAVDLYCSVENEALWVLLMQCAFQKYF